MIFNTLQMENIRSYQTSRIDFPGGTSLFEGDVGSGKSTILMAMEFALFGLGNQRGDALLRKGSKKGSVLLSFSVGGKDYQVKRTLIRSGDNTIRQDKGILGENGKRSQLAPSEIKERILDILNFKEPLNPRAQSVIFRYAVYTPQEEMKFILSQKPDHRLQTLRKAFGIEDYKIAAENATLISKSIKDKINYLSGQISDLAEKKKDLVLLEDKLVDNETNLRKFNEKKDEIQAVLTGQKNELEKLKETESELKRIETEIPHLEKQITDKKELSSKYQGEIQSAEEENQQRLIPELDKLEKLEKPTSISQDKLKEKIDQIKTAITKRNGLIANLTLLNEDKQNKEIKLQDWKDKDLDELNRENEILTQELGKHKNLLNKHQTELQIIIGKIYTLEAQKEDIDKKLENLDGLGEVCPICGSLLDEAHKKDLKQERRKEIRKFNSEIKILTEVKSKGEEEIESDNTSIRQLEEDLKEYESLIEKFKGLYEVKSKINSVEEELSNIDEKLSLNIGENIEFGNFDQYINHLETLLERLNEYNQAQDSLRNIEYQYHKNNEKIEENKASIENLRQEIDTLSASLSIFQDKIKHMPVVMEKTGELQSLHDNTEKEYSSVNEDIISTRTMIESLTQDVLKLEDEIKEKERLHKQLDKLKDYHLWLNDYLIPTLSVIEKHVMQNIHQEFDENFKKWFNLLIDDPSKTGKIDEEFTPIIEQDGFQQEINYLSGGEKTSVALAYRLALNNIVQKVSTGMKSNLLILDEPTDGFSKEQLFKIRDILNELNYPQIIIVSHERELESFADNIFQIEKIDGVSEVSQVN